MKKDLSDRKDSFPECSLWRHQLNTTVSGVESKVLDKFLHSPQIIFSNESEPGPKKDI